MVRTRTLFSSFTSYFVEHVSVVRTHTYAFIGHRQLVSFERDILQLCDRDIPGSIGEGGSIIDEVSDGKIISRMGSAKSYIPVFS